MGRGRAGDGVGQTIRTRLASVQITGGASRRWFRGENAFDSAHLPSHALVHRLSDARAEGLALTGGSEEGEDDEEKNEYGEVADEEDEEEEEGEEEEEEEEGGDDDGGGYDENGVYQEGSNWPDPARLQNMQAAAAAQRVACLELIGDKAFDEL